MKSLIAVICGSLSLSCGSVDPVLHDANGQEVHPAKLKGNVIVLNYWADWCDGCANEMSELNHFHQHHPDVNLYGVNYDHLLGTELHHAMHKMKINFPVLADDPAKVWQMDELEVLPVTLIVSTDGKVMKKIIGPTTEQELSGILQQLNHV